MLVFSLFRWIFTVPIQMDFYSTMRWYFSAKIAWDKSQLSQNFPCNLQRKMLNDGKKVKSNHNEREQYANDSSQLDQKIHVGGQVAVSDDTAVNNNILSCCSHGQRQEFEFYRKVTSRSMPWLVRGNLMLIYCDLCP